MFKLCSILIKTNHKNICLLLLAWVFHQPTIAINLMEIVNYVLDTHPAILANERSVDVSEYNYYQTFGQFLPEINYRRDQNRSIYNNASNPPVGPLGPQYDNVYLNSSTNAFELNQNLFSGFKDFNANRAAMWRYTSTKENALFNINTQVLDVIISYITVLQQEKILTIALDNEKFFQKALDNLEKLFESGATDKADFLLVKNNLQYPINFTN